MISAMISLFLDVKISVENPIDVTYFPLEILSKHPLQNKDSETTIDKTVTARYAEQRQNPHKEGQRVVIQAFNAPLFISSKPYLNQHKKIVYLFSDQNIGSNILLEEDCTLFGSKMIAAFKNIYHNLYSEEQNPPQIFNKFGNYIIDHHDELTQNNVLREDLLEKFYQKDLILKHFLPARIYKSVLLTSLSSLFQLQGAYSEVAYQAHKALEANEINSQNAKILILQNLWNFFGLCTKDGFMVFPAKRTVDSKTKNQVTDNDEHMVMDIVSKYSRRYWSEERPQSLRSFQNSKVFQLTEATFTLLNKVQNEQDYIQIKLRTQFYLSGSSYMYFEEFFSSVLEKYTEMYLQKPFDSSVEQNLNKIKPSFKKKQIKLDWVHKVWLKPKQNLIINFIKAIDSLIILYLAFEEITMHLKEENYIEEIMDPSIRKRRNLIEHEIAISLYNSTKDYLEGFTEFKRRNFSFRHDFVQNLENIKKEEILGKILVKQTEARNEGSEYVEENFGVKKMIMQLEREFWDQEGKIVGIKKRIDIINIHK